MAQLLLNWTVDADLLECPDYITSDLMKYQKQFDTWIYDETNQHNFWTIDCEGGKALCFDGAAFLCWLNEFIIIKDEEKAYFLKQNFTPSEEEKKLPVINF